MSSNWKKKDIYLSNMNFRLKSFISNIIFRIENGFEGKVDLGSVKR